MGNTGYGYTVAAGLGRVFTSCSSPPYFGGVCAYRASTGKLMWQYSVGCSSALPNCQVIGSPVYANGVVYYSSSDAGCCHNDTVSAVDALTGKAVWTFQTGDLGGTALAVGDGQVYFACTATNFAGICALSQSTGALNWSYNTGNANNTITEYKGVVYTNFRGSQQGGYVLALNAASGGLIWQFTYPDGNYCCGPVSIAKHVAYFDGVDQTLYALHATTGAQIWTAPQNSPSAVSIANGVAYIDRGLHGSGAIAYDARTGSALWYSQGDGSTIQVAPVIANGILYAANISGCGDVCAFSLPAARTRGSLPSRIIRR